MVIPLGHCAALCILTKKSIESTLRRVGGLMVIPLTTALYYVFLLQSQLKARRVGEEAHGNITTLCIHILLQNKVN